MTTLKKTKSKFALDKKLPTYKQIDALCDYYNLPKDINDLILQITKDSYLNGMRYLVEYLPG